MKKVIAIVLTVVVLAGLIGGGVVMAGDGLRASKATAVTGNLTWLGPNTAVAAGWANVLDQPIRVAQKKDLFIDVSMLCGLFTQTEVTDTGNTTNFDEGTAKALIKVRVFAKRLVDGVLTGDPIWATPPRGIGSHDGSKGVIFAMREQTMWVELNTDNVTDNITIGLALDTMNAHSFNFIIPNLESGDYMVITQALTETIPAPTGGKNKGRGQGEQAWASIGCGSVTIEQVRMANNMELIDLIEPVPD